MSGNSMVRKLNEMPPEELAREQISAVVWGDDSADPAQAGMRQH